MQGNSELKLLNSADNMPIDYRQWLAHYEQNKGIYEFIFRQQIRRLRYDLEYGSELDDLRQSIQELILKHFNRYETILFKYKYNVYSQVTKRVIMLHIKHINRFKGYPANNDYKKTGEQKKDYFSGQNERIIATSDNYSNIDYKLDLKNTLTAKQYKICKLLLEKNSKAAIARMLKVNECVIYKHITSIRKKLIAAGLDAL